MKSRSYIQLPLVQFRLLFPEQAAQIPVFLDSDPLYIVRYDYISGRIEFGYEGDKWLIH